MSAGKYDLVIEQGATLDRTFTLKNPDGTFKDLTGYTARAMIRESYTSAAPIVSLVSPTDITVGTTDGTIRIQMTAAATAILDFYRAVWDLEIVSGATVSRVLKGECTLDREATK